MQGQVNTRIVDAELHTLVNLHPLSCPDTQLTDKNRHETPETHHHNPSPPHHPHTIGRRTLRMPINARPPRIKSMARPNPNLRNLPLRTPPRRTPPRSLSPNSHGRNKSSPLPPRTYHRRSIRNPTRRQTHRTRIPRTPIRQNQSHNILRRRRRAHHNQHRSRRRKPITHRPRINPRSARAVTHQHSKKEKELQVFLGALCLNCFQSYRLSIAT